MGETSPLSNLPEDVLHTALHYVYCESLPTGLSEATAKSSIKLLGKTPGFAHFTQLCETFLKNTALKQRQLAFYLCPFSLFVLLFLTCLFYCYRYVFLQGSQGPFKSLEIDFSIKGLLSPLIQPMGPFCLSGGPFHCRVPLKSICEHHFKVRANGQLYFCHGAVNCNVTT